MRGRVWLTLRPAAGPLPRLAPDSKGSDAGVGSARLGAWAGELCGARASMAAGSYQAASSAGIPRSASPSDSPTKRCFRLGLGVGLEGGAGDHEALAGADAGGRRTRPGWRGWPDWRSPGEAHRRIRRPPPTPAPSGSPPGRGAGSRGGGAAATGAGYKAPGPGLPGPGLLAHRGLRHHRRCQALIWEARNPLEATVKGPCHRQGPHQVEQRAQGHTQARPIDARSCPNARLGPPEPASVRPQRQGLSPAPSISSMGRPSARRTASRVNSPGITRAP